MSDVDYENEFLNKHGILPEQAVNTLNSFTQVCPEIHPYLFATAKIKCPECANVQLKEDIKFLRCLEAAGVDNWSGYDYAQELFQEDSKDG